MRLAWVTLVMLVRLLTVWWPHEPVVPARAGGGKAVSSWAGLTRGLKRRGRVRRASQLEEDVDEAGTVGCEL